MPGICYSVETSVDVFIDYRENNKLSKVNLSNTFSSFYDVTAETEAKFKFHDKVEDTVFVSSTFRNDNDISLNFKYDYSSVGDEIASFSIGKSLNLNDDLSIKGKLGVNKVNSTRSLYASSEMIYEPFDWVKFNYELESSETLLIRSEYVTVTYKMSDSFHIKSVLGNYHKSTSASEVRLETFIGASF